MRSVATSALAAFVTVTLAAAAPARAEDVPSAPTERVYYGWQNLGADAAAVGLLTLGLDHGGSTAWAGLGVYALGGPIVHMAHGHYQRAAGSLALRVGLPLVFGYGTAVLIGGSDGGSDDIGGGAGDVVGIAAMGAVGAVLAVFADDVGLSWDEKPVGPTWAPTVQPSPNGMTFGVGGTF